MGNTGAYIAYGILALVLIPVVMYAVGSAFGETFEEQNDNTGWAAKFAEYKESFADKSDMYIFGGIFELLAGFMGLLSKIAFGFSVFPWWLNLAIFTIPTLLIVRGVFSFSG